MYRVGVDQITREEVAAAAAVHQDLGPSYTDAVSEALVERIGAEIDKRVDARLAPGRQAASASRPAWVQVAVAASSMACGVGATGIVLFATASNLHGTLHNAVSSNQLLLVAVIWAVIAVVNVSYARHQR
jgi:CHASE3 domain sensor protein